MEVGGGKQYYFLSARPTITHQYPFLDNKKYNGMFLPPAHFPRFLALDHALSIAVLWDHVLAVESHSYSGLEKEKQEVTFRFTAAPWRQISPVGDATEGEKQHVNAMPVRELEFRFRDELNDLCLYKLSEGKAY